MNIADKLTQIAENEQKVYDSGYSKAEYDWWVKFTNNNTRTSYAYAFYASDFEYIRPPFKLDMSYTNASSQTFASCKKLKKIEKAYFDFSKKPISQVNQNSFYWTFASSSSLLEIEDIGMQAEYMYSSTFKYCGKLHTIEKIRVANYTRFENTFARCGELKNLTIEGVIGQNGFNVQWSTKLSKDSITSIINALSTETTGLTVTLSATAVNSAFGGNTSAEWLNLISTKSNWIISLV